MQDKTRKDFDRLRDLVFSLKYKSSVKESKHPEGAAKLLKRGSFKVF